MKGDRTPLFPFGYGLSFTSFKYGGLAIKTPDPGSDADVVVIVDVTNTGKRDGDEIAQLYVHHDVSSVETADRSLEGFPASTFSGEKQRR